MSLSQHNLNAGVSSHWTDQMPSRGSNLRFGFTNTPLPSQAPPQPIQGPSAPVASSSDGWDVNPTVTNPLGLDLFKASSPKVKLPTADDIKDKLGRLRYPKMSWEIRQAFANAPKGHPSEPRKAQEVMAYDIAKVLDADARLNFIGLLQRGTLFDTSAEDGHTTLYHLYGILTNPRATGIDNKLTLDHTLRILNKPYTITQKFTPLEDTIAQQIALIRNNWQKMQDPRVMSPLEPIQWQDIKKTNSATCVSSSVMFYMADKNPSEFVRHIKELTSPRLSFTETAKLNEISPDAPEQAYQVLKDNKILFYPGSNPSEVKIIVNLPYSAYLRTMNDTFKDPTHTRTGIETAYQSALTFLATATYDPATDTRLDFYDTIVASKGLAEEEKTLMETIVKDNGGVQSVTYQVVQGKAQPASGEEGMPFLYGYFRQFEQITQDMLDALSMGEYITIGITETEYDSSIAGGHEIEIVDAGKNLQTGEIFFKVADSDDNVPDYVWRPARELIPKIHHAGMPLQLARKINGEVNTLKAQNLYFIPDQSDLAHFDPLLALKEPLPVEEPLPPPESAPPEALPGHVLPRSPISTTLPGVNPAMFTLDSAVAQSLPTVLPRPITVPMTAQNNAVNPFSVQ